MGTYRIEDVESFDLPGRLPGLMERLFKGEGDGLGAYRESLTDLLAAPAQTFEVVCRLVEQRGNCFPGLVVAHIAAMNDAGRPQAALAAAISLATDAADEGEWTKAGRLLDLAVIPTGPCPHPAFELAPTRSAPDLQLGLLRLAQNAVNAGEIDWASSATAMASAIAELSGRPQEIARVKGVEGGILLHQHKPAEAEAAYVTALELLGEDGEWQDIADALLGVAHARAELGKYDEGLPAVRRALEYYREHGDAQVTAAESLLGIMALQSAGSQLFQDLAAIRSDPHEKD